MRQLKGSGLGNVYLLNGYAISGDGDERAIAYEDLDGLYRAIALAIARRNTIMTGQELRFLRKRLGMSQNDVGALGGKSDQVAAKWEKGTLPVPPAEARLIRLSVLNLFGTRSEVSAAIKHLAAEQTLSKAPFVFKHTPAGWIEDGNSALIFSLDLSSQAMTEAVARAMETSAYEVGYTSRSRTAQGIPIALLP